MGQHQTRFVSNTTSPFKPLLSLKGKVPTTPTYGHVSEGWYQTTRHGQTKKVLVVEIKKDEIVVKDDPSHQHTHSISRAKFDKYYVPA